MSFHVVAISDGYKRLATLPAEASPTDAARELIAHSTRRVAPVVLRDGATGKRTSVEAAMDQLGFTWIERWQPQKGLQRVGAAAAEQLKPAAA